VTVICSVQIMMRWQKINAVSGTYRSYFSSRLLFPLLPLCLSYPHGIQRICLNWAVLTTNSIQAAQATFKSIKSLVPLLDRVLVQRFKPETVRPRTSSPFHSPMTVWCCPRKPLNTENGHGDLPPVLGDVESAARSDRDRRRARRAGQRGPRRADVCQGGRSGVVARLGRERHQVGRGGAFVLWFTPRVFLTRMD